MRCSDGSASGNSRRCGLCAEYQEQAEPWQIYSGVLDSMFSGYRGIVVALGLILAANHAYAKGGSEQPQTHQSVASSLEQIAAHYDDATKRAEIADQQEAPCGPRKYNSHADLCAQWKAADAAADSAWWAWAGGIIGVGSLIGVLIAIGLAFHSNWIARDTARRELRAYVLPSGLVFDWKISLKDGRKFMELRAVFKNTGHTPTRSLKLIADVSFASVDEEQFNLAPPIEQHNMLGPSEEIRTPITFVSDTDVIEVFKDVKNLFLFGVVFYDDVFGKSHETRFCWRLKFQKSAASDIPDLVTWEYSGLHNCSDEECDIQRKALVNQGARS